VHDRLRPSGPVKVSGETKETKAAPKAAAKAKEAEPEEEVAEMSFDDMMNDTGSLPSIHFSQDRVWCNTNDLSLSLSLGNDQQQVVMMKSPPY
jgi:hypothetical protein